MAETMNMMEISIETFIDEIKADLEDENYDPFMGIGKSGIGKTMGIYELTQELGIGFCELRLVTLTEVDLLGIPVTNEYGRTTYASNDLLPNIERDGEKGILVLDEITSCTSTIRAAAYQLLDSKRALGNYKLPPKWKVVALGNGIDDGGAYSGMEGALISRTTAYRVEPNLESWKKWALKNGVNPAIIAYLNFDSSKIHQFDPDEFVSVFPCPRSWTSLSKKLNAREKRNGGRPLSIDSVALYAAGAVGEREADSFASFYEYRKKTISTDDILNGKINGKVVKELEPQVIYLAIQQLIAALRSRVKDVNKDTFTEEDIRVCANAANWLIDAASVRLDYGITGVVDLSNSVPYFQAMVLLSDEFDEACPRLMEFAEANNILIAV